MSEGSKRFFQIVGFMAVAIAIFKWDWWLHGGRATQRQELLKKELSEIGRCPDCKQLSLNSTYKMTSGVLDEQDISSREAPEIEQWYSSELARLGWVSKGMEMHGREQIHRFCRNNETVYLTIPQVEEGSGDRDTTYKVQIGWGGPWVCN
jgi:hypothetical protein